MDTTKMSVAALVQSMEQQIEKIEEELIGLRRMLVGLRDHTLADEIIAGVKENGSDEEVEVVCAAATIRVETARAEQLVVPQEAVFVEERQEGKKENTADKLLVYVQMIAGAQRETKKAAGCYGLAKQGCVNRSRALVREAKEMEFMPAEMKLIEKLVVENRLPPEVVDLMDEEAEKAVVEAAVGKKARALLYNLVGTVFRLKPKRDEVKKNETEGDGPATDNFERARQRAERERKRKERADRDRDYTTKMHGNNAPPPKHGKR